MCRRVDVCLKWEKIRKFANESAIPHPYSFKWVTSLIKMIVSFCMLLSFVSCPLTPSHAHSLQVSCLIFTDGLCTHRIVSISSSLTAMRRSASLRNWPYSEVRACERFSSALRPYKRMEQCHKKCLDAKRFDFKILFCFSLTASASL